MGSFRNKNLEQLEVKLKAGNRSLKYPRAQEMSGQHSFIMVKIRKGKIGTFKKKNCDSEGIKHEKGKARSQLSVTRSPKGD